MRFSQLFFFSLAHLYVKCVSVRGLEMAWRGMACVLRVAWHTARESSSVDDPCPYRRYSHDYGADLDGREDGDEDSGDGRATAPASTTFAASGSGGGARGAEDDEYGCANAAGVRA